MRPTNRKTTPKVIGGKPLSRGEKYAEEYAYKYEKVIWNKYQEAFIVIFG
jgi:hypothetical protein